MSSIPPVGRVSLALLLALFALSILLLVIEVLRSEDLSASQKLAWALALVVGSFFTAVIYFAQGRTGRLGRIASLVMSAGILMAIGIIVALALRL